MMKQVVVMGGWKRVVDGPKVDVVNPVVIQVYVNGLRNASPHLLRLSLSFVLLLLLLFFFLFFLLDLAVLIHVLLALQHAPSEVLDAAAVGEVEPGLCIQPPYLGGRLFAGIVWRRGKRWPVEVVADIRARQHAHQLAQLVFMFIW
jgi:hypothetical protein